MITRRNVLKYLVSLPVSFLFAKISFGQTKTDSKPCLSSDTKILAADSLCLSCYSPNIDMHDGKFKCYNCGAEGEVKICWETIKLDQFFPPSIPN